VPLFTRVDRRAIVILNPPPNDPRPKRLISSESVAVLLQLGGIFSLFYYGVGWLLINRFLAPFSISPEEIGLTPAWILLRVPVFLFPTIGAFIIAWLLAYARAQIPAISYWPLVMLVSLVTFAILVRVAPSPLYYSSLQIALYYATLLTSISLIIFGVYWWSHRTPTTSAIGIGALLLVLAISATTFYLFAATEATIVRNGITGSYAALFNIPILHEVPVTVFELTGQGTPKQLLPCATFLGSANGTTIVISPPEQGSKVWRLPTDQVAIREGCFGL
jgi:hypothetical protein